jgi:asparagine synthase (glutamine-hydrolysing)
MSAILGLFCGGERPPDDATASRMLAALRRHDAERTAIRDREGATLAVSRADWEFGHGFSGSVLVAEDGELSLAADASLYYRDDLRSALAKRGLRPRDDTPSHLILAAYRAWGDRCVDHLEGDYAFLVWDSARQRLFCARDFNGSRPLYYARIGPGYAVASALGALLAHPQVSPELNAVAIAEAAAGLFASSHETCYRSISMLPAGHTLQWNGDRLLIRRFWEPVANPAAATLSFEAAAEELRELLRRAVAEQLDPERPTTVWLSGGYDSGAIFAAGEFELERRRRGEHLQAVSISYPAGDPGREDELIKALVAHWGSRVHWIDIGDVPLLDRPEDAARTRAEPFAHVFETWNRALVTGSRRAGARVALVGAGGDPLFATTPLYVADLLRAGRLRALAREWRAWSRAGATPRQFLSWALHPLLPDSLVRLRARLQRLSAPVRPFQPVLADWFDSVFARSNQLLERELVHSPARGSRSFTEYETYRYLVHPFTARIASAVAGFGVDGGVEVRLPLCDRRVVEFAFSRPLEDRVRNRETKRLLRASMSGLMPQEVLAPRRNRTGVTSTYFRRSMREVYAGLLTETFRAPILAELGIVDGVRLRKATEAYLQQQNPRAELQLFFTLQTELWLRSRLHNCIVASEPCLDGAGPGGGDRRPTGRMFAGASS